MEIDNEPTIREELPPTEGQSGKTYNEDELHYLLYVMNELLVN